MDKKVVVVRYHNSEITEVNFEYLLNTHRADCISYHMSPDNLATVQFETEEAAATFCNSIKVMMKASAERKTPSTANYISTHYLGEEPPEPPKKQSIQTQPKVQQQTSSSRKAEQACIPQKQEPLSLDGNDVDEELGENQSTPPHIALALRGGIPQPNSPRVNKKKQSPTRQKTKVSTSQSPPGKTEARKGGQMAAVQSVLVVDAKSISPWTYYQLHITGLRTRDDFTRIIRDCSSFGKSIQKWSFYSPNQKFGSYALPQNETAQKWLAFVQENLYAKDVTGWKVRVSKIQSFIIILYKISPQVDQKKFTELVKSVKGKVLYSRLKVGQADLHFTKKENMVKFIEILKSTGIPNNMNELFIQPMSDALVEQMTSSKSPADPLVSLKGLSLHEPPQRPQEPGAQGGNDDDQEYGNDDNEDCDDSRETDESDKRDYDSPVTSFSNPTSASKSDGKAPAKIPTHKPIESNSKLTSPQRSTKSTRDSILPAPKYIFSSGSDRGGSSSSVSTDSTNHGSSETLLVRQTVMRANDDIDITKYTRYLSDFEALDIKPIQSDFLSEKKNKTKGSTYAMYTAHFQGNGTVLLKEFNPTIQPDVDNFISVLKTAARLRHENIVNIIGVCVDSITLRPLGYFTENFADSNLQKLYLDNRPENTEDLAGKFLDYMIQTIQAVLFLHTNGVTYFPLQSRNVFIVGDKVKLSEQGLGNYFREMKEDGSNVAAEKTRQSEFYLVNRFGIILYECATGRSMTHVNASIELTPEIIASINIPSKWTPEFNWVVCRSLRSSSHHSYFLHDLLGNLQKELAEDSPASFLQGTELGYSLGTSDSRRLKDSLSTSSGDSYKRSLTAPELGLKIAPAGGTPPPTHMRISNSDTHLIPTPSSAAVAKASASGADLNPAAFVQQPTETSEIPTRTTQQPTEELRSHGVPSTLQGQVSANTNAYNGQQGNTDLEGRPLTKDQSLEAPPQPPASLPSSNTPQPFYPTQPIPNITQPMNPGTQPQMQAPYNTYAGQYAQPEPNPANNPYVPNAAAYNLPTYPPANPPTTQAANPSWNFSGQHSQYNPPGAPVWNAAQPPYQQTQPQWNAHPPFNQSNLPVNPPANSFQPYAPVNPQSSAAVQPQPGQPTNVPWSTSGQHMPYNAQGNHTWNPAVPNVQPQQTQFQPLPWNSQSPYQQYPAPYAQQSNPQSVNLQGQQLQQSFNTHWNPHSQYPQQQNYTAPPYDAPSNTSTSQQTGAHTWNQQTSAQAQSSQYYPAQQTSSDYQTRPNQPYNTKVTQYTGQQNAQATQYTGQQNAQVTQYTGQQNAQATQYTGQQNAQATQYTGQQSAQATQYTGQQSAQATQYTGQQSAQVTQYTGQQNAQATQYTGQQNAQATQSYQYNSGHTASAPQYGQAPTSSPYQPFAPSNQPQNLFNQPLAQYPSSATQPQAQQQHHNYQQQTQPTQSQWSSA